MTKPRRTIDMTGVPGFRNEPGWTGGFTRSQAPGAIPNGTRIVKCNSEPDDGRKDGAPGAVLGSINHPAVHGGAILYFVEWDAHPRVAVATLQTKIARPS